MVEITLSGISSGHWTPLKDDALAEVGEKILLTLDQLETHAAAMDNEFALRLSADVDGRAGGFCRGVPAGQVTGPAMDRKLGCATP